MGDASIVDAHVHVWADDRQQYPMVPGQERPAEHRGSTDWLVELMDSCGVAGALLVQTPWYGEDNRYFVDSMRRFPGRFVSLGYLDDPLAADAAEKLSHQYHAAGFRGIRLHLNDPRVGEGAAAGKADRLIRRAGELGVPVQFLNRMPNMPLIHQLAARFADVTMIVDHLGHPDMSEGPPYPAAQPFFALGELPNIYVKVAVHHSHSQVPYPWHDLREYQQRTLDSFGPQRLLWGSNFPMSMPADDHGGAAAPDPGPALTSHPTYAQRLDAVRTELPFLTETDRAWLLGKTAATLWAFSAADAGDAPYPSRSTATPR